MGILGLMMWVSNTNSDDDVNLPLYIFRDLEAGVLVCN